MNMSTPEEPEGTKGPPPSPVCIFSEPRENTTIRYDAFGNFIHEGSLPPWLFSGQRFDPNTQLYHFTKRSYDPFIGRWLTPDPLCFADGPNLYAYVHNNPLTFVDPYGLWREEARDFCHGVTRGAIDDTTWNTSRYALGEFKASSQYGNWGYHIGTGASMVGGLFYGNTWAKLGVKGGGALLKNSLRTTSVNTVLKPGSIKQIAKIEGTTADKAARSFKAQKILKVEKNKKNVQNGTGSRRRFEPDPKAEGEHTTYRRDPITDKITHYETYKPQTNPYDPKPWESIKRYDNSGQIQQSHFNKILKKDIPEPHVHDSSPGGVRPAEFWEMPR
jgi:RHS repeat-associated protein